MLFQNLTFSEPVEYRRRHNSNANVRDSSVDFPSSLRSELDKRRIKITIYWSSALIMAYSSC